MGGSPQATSRAYEGLTNPLDFLKPPPSWSENGECCCVVLQAILLSRNDQGFSSALRG